MWGRLIFVYLPMIIMLLGTSVMVDGAPLSNNANMQVLSPVSRYESECSVGEVKRT